jgi:type IV pilus assembly protein PilC
MLKFSYVVKNRDGKTIKNVVEAGSKKDLIENLQAQGFFISEIKELTITKPAHTVKQQGAKRKKFTHNKVKPKDLLTFARQLATMLDSGVSLVRSLGVIISQAESRDLFRALSKVRDDIQQGESLSQALAQHPRCFNIFWISLIEVGEASGTIPTVLKKLEFYSEQQLAFRAKIISGLIYPAILFVIMILAILVFALFIGPRFESIFKSMNAELPAITVILLGTFKTIKKYFFVILGGFIALIFIFKQYTKTYSGKLMWENFLFRMPLLGKVFKNIIVERFTSQMTILIDSGVPILFALDISERLVSNATCANIISHIKNGVRNGELLVSPMERSEFFPPMAIQMIMVGEETGELSKMLNHVAVFYQQDVEKFMERFGSIVEPIMLVFMAIVIGLILVAMFLPMFNIAQLGGGGM